MQLLLLTVIQELMINAQNSQIVINKMFTN